MQGNFLPSFVKRKARGVSSENKRDLRDNFLKEISIDEDNIQFLLSQDAIIEIGSGNGDTIIALAGRFPSKFFVACEVFIEGILQACNKIKSNNLQNIRFFTKDARILLAKLPDNFLDKALLLFPDPWPKKRHNKRRIINKEFLILISRVLKVGSSLLVATDHEDYKLHIKDVAMEQNLLKLSMVEAPDWWVETKYQKKALKEGRSISFFEFIK